MSARSILFTLWGDVFLDREDAVPLATATSFMQTLGFRPDAVRAALARMAREGWYVSARHGRQSSYSLTPIGYERLRDARRRIYQVDEEPWQGTFRTLGLPSPALPPARRRPLLRELQWVGWAQVGPYQWLSPIARLEETFVVLSRHGIHGAWVLSGSLSGKDPIRWIEELYPIAEIDARYQGFLQDWASVATVRSEAEAFIGRIELVHAWRKLLFIDPGLPHTLLPPHFARTEAQALFHDLYAAWLEPSALFVAHQTGSPVLVS